MDSEIVSKWFAYWRPLELGLTPDGHANGLMLTLGVFWARTLGGYNLYRWTGSSSPVQTDRIVGAASAGAREISNFPFIGHDPSTVYWYLLRAVGGGGVEESTTHQLRQAEFDADGALIGPRPNPPVGLTVDLPSRGRICMRWSYDPTNQEVSPGSFEIYSDYWSSGQIDYDTPLDTVAYSVGQEVFEWMSGMVADGKLLWGAVRAKSPDGVLEDNTITIAARADWTSPPVHTSVAGTRTNDMP